MSLCFILVIVYTQGPNYMFICLFSQMVFASANKLGCGLAQCSSFFIEGIDIADSPSLLLICAYEG